ncbi:hypothetical protein Bca52824_062983 [Brassica carinata]|uniref:Uncharacterized protein n=1 Tax=Brassica carinata TaxID=52824 RepID=A0A8X7QI22_BRACI|nr:hypothetical protein Bca52824_062983 [Brassica carinata]
MRHELRPSGVLIMLLADAAHLHHPTTFVLENPQKLVTPLAPTSFVSDPHLVVDERQTRPGTLTALRSEHGVSAEDVELFGEVLEEEGFRELFDGEDVNEEGAAAEELEGEGSEDGFGGEDGGSEEEDVEVLLAEIVGVVEETSADRGSGVGVVGAGVGDQVVAVSDEGLGEELAEVSETQDGDFEEDLRYSDLRRVS